jgi:hypothetical protein
MMNRLKQIVRRHFPDYDERGSALLVTLMVMVGLSLLGLGFVAISETESAIASNERNSTQTLQIAEAGGKTVIEWFQDPQWALDQGLMPVNDAQCATTPCIKAIRRLGAAAPYAINNYYKPTTGQLLFDRSYRVDEGRFFGTEDNPDILINDKTAATFLAQLNIRLFNTTVPATLPTGLTSSTACTSCDNTQGGRITEIRIYAPPTVGGITNSQATWTSTAGIPAVTAPTVAFTQGGSRYGVATIRVTAVKYVNPQCGPFKTGCSSLAQRVVKFVVAEWPVPGPGGPVQSASDLTNAGNVQIHWGRSTSEQDLSLTKSEPAIPWHDAYNIANIERGYDTTLWPAIPADTDYKKRIAWLPELIGRAWNDPWWGARARGTVAQLSVATQPHPQTWDITSSTTPPNTGAPAQSNLFQLQTKSDGGNYREVLFPRIDYNFWKQVAVASADMANVKYLRWSSGENFTDRSGCTMNFEDWVNTNSVPAAPNCNGGKAPAGFYFFDTMDGTNPQNIVNPTNLTPQVAIHGATIQMKGFIYLNASDYKTTGVGGVPGQYNMPGEPYRDIGFRKVEVDSSSTWYKQGARVDPSTPCVWATGVNCVDNYNAGNGLWDFQDLPWSNLSGAAAGDNIFQVHVSQRPAIVRLSAPILIGANTEYFVDPFTPGCIPGDNSCGTCTCSEPHEPYLNFVYPSTSSGTVTARWEAPASQTRRPKITASGTPVSCTSTSPDTSCTSNAYDRDGALVALSPILDGVLYLEGTDTTTGNATYFGSLLIRQAFNNKGTPDVWFDEKLVKGAWPPKSFNFPRVYVSAEETDQ